MSFLRARMLPLVAMLLVAFAAPSIAAAEPEPEVSSGEPETAVHDQWDRLIGAEITGGFDTPYGVAGAALVIAPIRHLVFDFGGGVSRDGARVAGGVRALVPFQDSALVLRVGIAGGALSWEGEQAGRTRRTWDFNGFIDASVGYEYRHPVGFYVRVELGVEHALNSTADTCETVTPEGTTVLCDGSGAAPIRTYLGLAFGYMFEVF